MASDSGSGQASLTQNQLSDALLKAREAGVPFYIGWQTSLLKHINAALASAPAVDRAGVLTVQQVKKAKPDTVKFMADNVAGHLDEDILLTIALNAAQSHSRAGVLTAEQVQKAILKYLAPILEHGIVTLLECKDVTDDLNDALGFLRRDGKRGAES